MAGGSQLAVYVALGANAVVTVAKLAGFAMTGSGAMLSEAVHSIADVGNQALLAVGLKRAQIPEDEDHPGGYGREAFVWSMVSAVGMFFLGSGVSLTHGIQALWSDGHHEPSGDHGMLNLGILLFALVIEGGALGMAVRGLQRDAASHEQSFADYLRTTDDPFGVAVLFEDGAAVLGVLVALGAVGMAHITGQAWWDAAGSIVIGLLLGVVALFLIQKNRTLLIGRAIRPEDRRRLQEVLDADPAVDHVALQRAVVTGTSTYRISAEIEFDGSYFAEQYMEGRDLDALHGSLETPSDLEELLVDYGEHVMKQVGDEVDRIEDRIREVLPKAHHINIEPD